MPDRRVKVPILGGSSVGTPALIDALTHQGQTSRAVDLALYGRTHDKLDPGEPIGTLLFKAI